MLGLRAGVEPCSAECAEQLAVGVRTLLVADVAVSATGVGGPDPEDGHPPGTVYLGWSSGAGVGHRLLNLDGGPRRFWMPPSTNSLDLLAELLLGEADSSD